MNEFSAAQLKKNQHCRTHDTKTEARTRAPFNGVRSVRTAMRPRVLRTKTGVAAVVAFHVRACSTTELTALDAKAGLLVPIRFSGPNRMDNFLKKHRRHGFASIFLTLNWGTRGPAYPVQAVGRPPLHPSQIRRTTDAVSSVIQRTEL